MAIFPTFPTTGKNSKIFISSNDGSQLTLAPMTKQAAYEYKGELFTNTVYLLGAGKTLINIRPAVLPIIAVDGILQGLTISPSGTNDKCSVSSGIIEYNGVSTAVAAEAAVALSRPANEKWCWNAIIVTKSTGAVTAVKGADADTENGLLSTYGTGAGQRPLIAPTAILIGWVKLYDDGAAVIASSDINYLNRENGGIDYQLLPNIGGIKLQTELAAIHTGVVAREVKFSGYYLDEVLSEIGTAKSWSLTAQTSQISDSTFGSNYSSTEISGFNFSFEQLAADKKVIDAAWFRQGHCAVRLQMPNGFYWQSVATVAPTINSAVGSMINISVSGSCGDFPQEA
jgi:hypothetical protein